MTTDGAVIELPSPRHEAWRYTPVDEIAARIAATTNATSRSSVGAVSRAFVDALAGDHGGPQLVFVNGAYAADLSAHDDDLPRGLRWSGTDSAGDDVAVVIVDPGERVPAPVHIVHVAAPASDGAGTIARPRTTVEIGDGSRVAVIETYCGLDGHTVTDASTTISVGLGAEVDLCRIQTESPAAVHLGATRIEQAAATRLRMTAVTVGGDIARHAVTVHLAGPGARAELAGLALTTRRQRHDTVVTVDHAASGCTSTQHVTGVVNDHGRGSFSGEIIVRPGTTATDAHQSSHNLILSPHAEADTRPWLQIFADDVRCTHGATVGRLDDDALFYLRSRGIPLPAARTMLVAAFVHEITERILHESLREQVGRLVAAAGATAIEAVP